MAILILGSSLFCLGAGIVIYAIKPRRFTNRVFLVTSLLAAFWLACVWAAIRTGEMANDPIGAPVIWIRLNGIASVFWVWALWLLTYAITTDEHDEPATLKRLSLWLSAPALITSFAFSEHYVRPTATNLKGPLYYVVAAMVYGILILLAWRIWKQIPFHKSIRRVEMQFLALPLAIGSIAVLTVTLIGNITGITVVKRLSFLPFIAGYGLSAWAITFHRLYNPREILRSLVHVTSVVALAATGSYYILEWFRGPTIRTADVLMSTAVAFSCALWLQYRIRNWFACREERTIAELRNAIAASTRGQSNCDNLVTTFERLLSLKTETRFVQLLLDHGNTYSGNGITLSKSQPGFNELHEQAWITPETLERRRTTRHSEDLQKFMACNSIAALIAAPRGHSPPSLLIALGEKKNGWPFTYPEVERMQQIADLIDNTLTHSRLATEAALKAKMEHLAMMSRGLAHDLKNLITPVSSFLVHSEPRMTPGTPEAEVHAAAKRSVALMTDYIREALFFANRLNPHFEQTPLRELLQSAADVTSARALRNKVHISVAADAAVTLMLDRVLIQRMLANLLNNAIDACAGGGAVTMSAANLPEARIRIQVKDSGGGIAPEHLSRIFDPYFTTKQFGDDVRGFGLGLTICDKIVRLHGGEISVDSELGIGTVVTVNLPAEPPMPPPVETAARSVIPELPTTSRAPLPLPS